MPTFAYEFNDDTAPQRFAPPDAVPAVAAHSSEIQYLFDQPNAPVPRDAQMLSLVPPQPQIETDFSSGHHCSFWAAG